MYLTNCRRPAYVFLLTVLVIGAIASAAATSLVLLGIARQQSSLTASQSAQALEMARTCVERGLRSLRLDLAYDGGVGVTLSEGSCVIRHLGGGGNSDRVLCTEGRSGYAVRRLEVGVRRVLPSTRIAFWNEVAEFTGACP